MLLYHNSSSGYLRIFEKQKYEVNAEDVENPFSYHRNADVK